jgi:DNA modification methylase
MNNLSLEYWNTEKLIDYARNPRKNDEVIKRMAASISEFGFTIPILAKSDGSIIDGHLRIKAAREIGIKTVPVVIADHLNESQVKAFRLLANRSANWAEWDEELLKIELNELNEMKFDLDLTGFDTSELDAYLSKPEPIADDEVAEEQISKMDELQNKWKVKLGEVWCLGPHRIICGDSTDVEVVAKVMGADVPNLMVTDPPYGVNYDASWRDEAAKHCEGMGNGKDTAKGKVQNDSQVDWSAAWSLFKGDVAYVWHAPTFCPEVTDSLIQNGFEIRSQIVWNKSHLVLSRGDYHWKHELCAYGVRKGKKSNWIGDRKQTSVWDINKPQKNETGHSTQKPLDCMLRPIQNHHSEFVYDPFCGSGTTIMACEQLGRKAIACELNPAYVSVILERYQLATGIVPIRQE